VRRSPKPGALSGDAQTAAQLVDHQRRERLAFEVLGDDQQRLAEVRHLLEQRQQLADREASSRESG
jgi:hypothetical protein